MTSDVSKAMVFGRVASGMKKSEASEELRISERHLTRYENGEIKKYEPHIIASAMVKYDSDAIGFTYLSCDPVYTTLFYRVACKADGAPPVAPLVAPLKMCDHCKSVSDILMCQPQ